MAAFRRMANFMTKLGTVDRTDSINQSNQIKTWEYNPSEEDPRLSHKFSPNRSVSLAHLHGLGVLSWKLESGEIDRMERSCNDAVVKTISPATMDDYEHNIKTSFQEHMHSKEEIRLILDGEGYYDIRDYDENWIRFCVQKGDLIPDLIVIPGGLFHRFTLTNTNYIKILILYNELPCRIQYGSTEDDDERTARRKFFLRHHLQYKREQHRLQQQDKGAAVIGVSAAVIDLMLQD